MPSMSIRLYCILLPLAFLVGIEGKPVVNKKLSERVNVLLNVTETEKKFQNVLEAYVNGDPNLAIFKSKIMSFLEQFLSFKSLRPHIVQIYSDLYTLSEINGLIKFYSSALGKKLVEKEGKVEIRLAQLIKGQLERQMPQMMVWFQQELNRDHSKDQTV